MNSRDKNPPVKFGIQLPTYYERWLRIWARVKGTTRANLAANILQARIEANREQIEKDLQAIADQNGITREELEKEWFNGDDE